MNKYKTKIYCDIDGVLADFNGAVAELLNIDLTNPYYSEYRGKLKKDIWFDKFLDGNFVWEKIEKAGHNFWANLKLLPWADDLVNTLNSFTGCELIFLSSPGDLTQNIYRQRAFSRDRSYVCGLASMGKTIWCQNTFPGVPLVIAYRKELLANPYSILIDDSIFKIEEFSKNNGKIFHWPNQYSLEDGDEEIYLTMESLKDKIGFELSKTN